MKVIVIGAGFTGLAASRALKLSRHACLDVTILEGSARVGGRAHTIKVGLCKIRLPLVATRASQCHLSTILVPRSWIIMD